MERERAIRCVVPANAGTHNHRVLWLRKVSAILLKRESAPYGSAHRVRCAHLAGTTQGLAPPTVVAANAGTNNHRSGGAEGISHPAITRVRDAAMSALRSRWVPACAGRQ